MTAKTAWLLLGAAAISLSTPAHAQEMSPEDAARLIERLDALEAEVTDLRAKLEAAEASSASQAAATQAEIAAANAAAAEAQANAAAAAKVAEVAPEITMKPTPEVEAGGFTFKPRGRLQYDVADVQAPDAIMAADNGLGTGTTLRRARLGVSGDMPGGFGYKFEVDFADNDVAITDAIITYGDGPLGLTVGQHNAFWGLEEITSSNHISFIERAAFTDAFGFARRVGVSADYSVGDMTIWGGLFSSSIDDLTSDEADNWGFDSRIVFAPKMGDTQLHFGGSVHWVDLDDNDMSVRYRQRPNIATTDTRFVNTGSFDAAETLSYGLEAAAVAGPLHFAGETHWQTASRPGADDPTFFGGYAEIGYFLTGGDSRGYKSGKFDRVRPVSPVGEGGMGALQANLRFDHLDLSSDGIVGGTQNAYGLSLIWTPMDYIRLMAQYQRLDISDAAILSGLDADYSVDVVGARAQVEF